MVADSGQARLYYSDPTMVDEQLILTAERLRDDLSTLKAALRKRYKSNARQVVADDLKATAAVLAETWLADLSQRAEVANAVSADLRADLTVHFTRLLTLTEHSSKRAKYDAEIAAIVRRFTIEVVIPLKQLRNAQPLQTPQPHDDSTVRFSPTAFLGHSFAPSDAPTIDRIAKTLTALGITVVTGTKPKADSISNKVKRLLDAQYLFVGVFTRRDKLSGKDEWTTPSWVIDEKAYAVGRGKKLVLLKEVGVGSIGGIQGDYEFLEFSRDQLDDLMVRIIELFDLTITGLA